MSRGRTTYGKRQREQEKRTKAKEKAQRRVERQTTRAEEPPEPATASESQLIDQLAAAHRAFEEGSLDHDEFEERRSDIGRQLDHVRRGT